MGASLKRGLQYECGLVCFEREARTEEARKEFRDLLGMAIPVDGSAAGPSSSGLTALLDAIRARRFSQLADILDTLELEVTPLF